MTSKVLALVKNCFLVVGVAAPILGIGPLTKAAEQPGSPSVIILQEKGHGWAIKDSDGMALYTYARDVQPGKSSCVEDCAIIWPSFLASEEYETDDNWSVINRDDGTKQWAYRGKPLYRYSVDQLPIDTYGEGSGYGTFLRGRFDLAFIPAPPPAGIKIQKTLIGYVAADNERMTLYAPDGEIDPGSVCVNNTCGPDWSPMLAPWAAHDLGEWKIISRQDGLRQWTYKGRPLFNYAYDVNPRETNGEGVEFPANGASWRAVVLQQRPPYPDWVTVHNTDAGQMLATLDGKNIYTYDPSRLRQIERERVAGCELECLDAEWIPIFASEAQVAPGGNWAIFTLSDGSRQWAYKGRRLFTNTRDKTQGSFLGYRHGGSRAWNIVMHSEDGLVGTLRPP